MKSMNKNIARNDMKDSEAMAWSSVSPEQDKYSMICTDNV